MFDRPDLDGKCLQGPGSPDVWLVFHGRRHKLASPQVFDALFDRADHVVSWDDVEAIAEGFELKDETLLVRPAGALSIFLVTGGPENRKHLIPTYDSLLEFGFAESRVRTVPELVVRALPSGRDLTGARDRAFRRG